MLVRPGMLVLLVLQVRGFGMAPAMRPCSAAQTLVRSSHSLRSLRPASAAGGGLRGLCATAQTAPAHVSGFDPEQAALYGRLASAHRHPQGPWKLMVEAVQKSVGGMEAPAILDLATGPGEPAASIAKALPKASVIATDASADMVAQAAKAGEGIMKAEVADMQDLHYADGSMDMITCSYGYMFPPDRQKAVDESFRVLKSGGYLVATTWDEIAMMKLLAELMAHVFGPQPPPAQNPLSLAEPGLFESMLTKAGFDDIKTSTSTYPMDITDDADLQFKLCTLLVKDRLAESPEYVDKARKFFEANVDKYSEVDAKGVRALAANTFKLTIARKP